MRTAGLKHRRVVHKSTAGILTSIPEAVDLVGNPPPGLTDNTVALPLAGEITEVEQAAEDFFSSLLETVAPAPDMGQSLRAIARR